MKSLLLTALIFYAALAVFAYLTADRQIFFPPASSYTRSELPVTLVPTEDGAEVAVLHLPNPEADLTVIHGHGNAEDLGHVAPLLREIHSAGFSVLGYDYRGYGASSGAPPTAEGAYRDIAAVYRYATEDLKIPPSNVVLYGRSVGSGPATDLAARKPVGGLIVESGFISAFRVVTRLPILPFDRFPNLRNIRKVNCPVLIIHGTDDEIIPLRHGRALFAAAPDPKMNFWAEGAHHNDLPWVAGDEYWKALREFRALLEAGR